MRRSKDKPTRRRSRRSRRPRRPRGAGRPWLTAFTLVELLTIIIILSMLIALSSPSILAARKIFKVRKSKGILHQLDGACEMFKADNVYYPPSRSSGFHWPNQQQMEDTPRLREWQSQWEDADTVNQWQTATSTWKGRHILVQCLMGYLSDSVDLEKGVGFRKRARGKVYGPYNGAERLERRKIQNAPTVFVDDFANEIHYYCYDNPGQTAGFNANDDADGPPNLQQYLTDPNGVYYRQDYVLMTPGPDRAWKDVNDDSRKVDDITNFTFRLLGQNP